MQSPENEYIMDREKVQNRSTKSSCIIEDRMKNELVRSLTLSEDLERGEEQANLYSMVLGLCVTIIVYQ